MRALAMKTEPIANGRDVIVSLGAKARRFKDTNLPKVASAAETTGKAISDFALSTSRSVSQSLRQQQPSKSSRVGALLGSLPLLRGAGRFAMRNPALLAAAGITVAAVGYLAWRNQQRQQLEPDDASAESAML